LTNEPDKLVHTALDTLTQTLSIECCWIQTISDRKNQKLALAADRGFSDAMRLEIASMDLTHKFSGEIIGMGNKITIPDLNNDGAYGLDSFRSEGYRWLVAVPLMTYRVYGLLGAACRNKKIFNKNTAELFMVVAAMIASALSKAELTLNFQRPSKPAGPATPVLETLPEKELLLPEFTGIKSVKATLPPLVVLPGRPLDTPPVNEVITAPSARIPNSAPVNFVPPAPPEKPADATAAKIPEKPTDPKYIAHVRQMESFRKAHGNLKKK
jgi:hypothetical protein